MPMKYYLAVYGCQMNISDAERAAAVLEQIGYKKTLNMNEADLILVTMCSIRQSAVDRIHGLVDKFEIIKKEREQTLPAGRQVQTILTGCVLKRDKKIFVDGFDYVLDIKDIKRIPQLLGAKTKIKNQTDYLDITPKYENKFSANVPIMTGCNNFCAYCVVPYVRGREISRPAKEIVLEIKKLINPTSPRLRGAKEKSINISDWPEWDEKLIKEDEMKIMIQVNGKVRGEIMVASNENEEKIKKEAQEHLSVKKFTEGKEIKKIIYVKNRLVNIVV